MRDKNGVFGTPEGQCGGNEAPAVLEAESPELRTALADNVELLHEAPAALEAESPELRTAFADIDELLHEMK